MARSALSRERCGVSTERRWAFRAPLARRDRQRHRRLVLPGARSETARPGGRATGCGWPRAGFDLIDVGAVAARSGPPVPAAEEAARLVPAIEGLARDAARAGQRRHVLARRSPGGRRRGGRRDQRHRRRRRPEMLELVAEPGCGLVVMHIEGPPRRTAPRELDDPVEHLKRWFAERIEAALARGVAEEQIAIDPGLDFDLTVDDDLEMLRRLGELHELGRPLFVSLSRKDFLGAVLAGSWEERAPAAEREWATAAAAALAVAAGAQLLRLHDRQRARRDAGRRPDRAMASRASELAPQARSRPRGRVIEPGRADGRLVAQAFEGERGRRAASRCRAALDPALRDGAARRPGSSASTRTRPRRSTAASSAATSIVTSGTASASRCRSTSRCSTRSRATRSARALYLYPTKALAQDQARKLSELGLASLRHAIYDGDTPQGRPAPDPAPLQPRAHQPGHAQRRDAAPPQAAGATSSPTSAGSWSTRRTPTAACSARTSPTCCGGCAASRGSTAPSRASSAPRRRSPTRSSSPSGWSASDFGSSTPTAPRAPARRIAMWNPPLIDEESGTRRSVLSEAAELLAELVARRRADDLLPAQPPRDRADPALRPDAARGGGTRRARRADRALPGRLHARSSGARSRRGWRPASCSRSSPPTRSSSGSTSASSTRRSASPSRARSPACARCGDARGAAARASRSTSPARTRSTSSSAAIPTSSSSARSRRRSSTTRTSRSSSSTCSPPPTRRRSSDARRRAARRALARARRAAGARSASCARGAAAATARAAPASPPAAISLRSASADSVAVVERGSGELLGAVEAERAFSTVHPGAVYLHLGRSYEVRELDVEARRAVGRAVRGRLVHAAEEGDRDLHRARSSRRARPLGVELSFGEVSVTEQVIAFQRKRLADHEVIDMVGARPPGAELPHPGALVHAAATSSPARAMPPEVLLGALHATEHSQIAVLPLLAMCDRWDIGGLSTNVHPQTGRPTIFIYDGYPGGVGIARRGLRRVRAPGRRRRAADRRVPVRRRLPLLRPEPEVRQPQRAAAQGRARSS